ncbi:MAG: hypothetical protein ACP5O1_09365 [Phycisphaerae bacterium]
MTKVMRNIQAKIIRSKQHWATWLLLSAGTIVLCGCTHVAGVVVYQGSHIPAKGTIVSVGEPATGFNYQPHPVDNTGHFDFYADPLDTNNIWVIPPHGDPSLDAIHLQPSQISSHMYVVLPSQ